MIDLFTEQATYITATREVVITCRVCLRKERAAFDAPALLCGACAADLAATARHVAERTALVYARWQREYEAFHALVADNPWWDKVTAARLRAMLEPAYAATVAQAWEAARKGPHAAIVADWETLDATSAEVEAITKWYAAAETELRAAAGETVERPPVGWRISQHGPRYLLRTPSGAATWHSSYDAALMAAQGVA